MSEQLEFLDAKQFKENCGGTRGKTGVRKQFASEVEKAPATDESNRVVRFVVSTDGVDRDKDKIDPNGWILDSFRKSPVVLWAHDNHRPPIARSPSIFTEDNKLKADAEFMAPDIDTSGFSDMIFRMVTNGFLSSTSVGFLPIEFEFEEEDKSREGGVNFSQQELMEFSVVPVGSNPEALIAAKKKGIDLQPLNAWFEEALDNWLEYRDMLLVPKKHVESLHKATRNAIGGKSKRYHLSNKQSEELLMQNLQAVRKQALDTQVQALLDGKTIETTKEGFEELKQLDWPDGKHPLAATSDHETYHVSVSNFADPAGSATIEEKAPVTFSSAHADSTSVADEEQEWDADGELSTADIGDLLVMSAWRADKDRDELTKDDFKLLHHSASEGNPVVWNGLVGAMAALAGANGGVDIPQDEKRTAYNHLARHYREDFDRDPPPFSEVREQPLAQEGFEIDQKSGLIVKTSDEDDEMDDEDEDKGRNRRRRDDEEENRAQNSPKKVQKSLRALPRIANRVYNTPLCVHEPKLGAILGVLNDRIGLDADDLRNLFGPTEQKESTDPFNAGLEESLPVDNAGIAVIPVEGTLVHRASGLDAMSGLSGYETMSYQVRSAAEHRDVRGIALHIDSFGGEAAGLFGLVDAIYDAKKKKPVWALVNEHAYSAAYAIASAADRIYVTRSGGVGSIGVVMVHADMSAKHEMQGESYTLLHAGDRKVDGNSFQPLSEDARKTLMKELNRCYEDFTETVARNRDLDIEKIVGTQASTFDSSEAFKLGLVDGVHTPTRMYQRFVDFLDSREKEQTVAKEEQSYSIEEKVGDKTYVYKVSSFEEFKELRAQIAENTPSPELKEAPAQASTEPASTSNGFDINSYPREELKQLVIDAVKEEVDARRGKVGRRPS